MHKSISIAFALALPFATTAVEAQVSGSINRDAPTVSKTVKFKNSASLHVSYTAILFGEGKWESILENKDRHEGFNTFAARTPIGTIKTNATVTASGREIPAGEYAMFFTVHEQAGWILNLKNKEGDAEPIRWRMAMQKSNSDNNRFNVSLDPGEKAGSCDITIAFGKKSVSVPLKIGAPGEMKKKMKKVGEAIR